MHLIIALLLAKVVKRDTYFARYALFVLLFFVFFFVVVVAFVVDENENDPPRVLLEVEKRTTTCENGDDVQNSKRHQRDPAM